MGIEDGGSAAALCGVAEDDGGLVDAGHKVVAAVVVAFLRGGGEDDTLAGAVDIACSDGVVAIIGGAVEERVGAHAAAEDGHIAVARVLGQEAVGLRHIAALAIALEVTDTHRGQVAAAVDILLHTATVHHHMGVAIHLAGGDIVDLGIIEGICGGVLKMVGVLVSSLTTAKKRAVDKAVVEGDKGAVVDVPVLTRTVDGAHNDIICTWGEIDGNIGDLYIGQVGKFIAVASLTAGGAIDIAAGAFGSFHGANMATRDIHHSSTSTLSISKCHRPTESKGGSDVSVANRVSDTTHRSHSASTIDITADIATMDIHLCGALHDTCQGVVFALWSDVGTATGAIDVATEGEVICFLDAVHGVIFCRIAADSATIDIDRGLLEHMAVLTGTIDGTLNNRSSKIATISTDGNDGVGGIGQAVEERVVYLTTAGAIDHTILVTIRTDGATEDLYLGGATRHPQVAGVIQIVGTY